MERRPGRGPALWDYLSAQTGIKLRAVLENRDNQSLLPGLLTKSGVAVEKGTKAVISVDFSVYRERTINNLRTNFAVKIP